MKKSRSKHFRSSSYCLQFTKFNNLSPTPHEDSAYKLNASEHLSMDFRKDKNVFFMTQRDRKRGDESNQKDFGFGTDEFQKGSNLNQKSRDTLEKKDNNMMRKKASLAFKTRFQKERKNNLIMNFISKLKKNSIYRQPVIYQPFQKCQQFEFGRKGVNLPKNLFMLYNFLSAMIIFVSCFIMSLLIYFTNSIKGFALNCCFAFIIAWFVLQLAIGFAVIKEKQEKKLIGLKQIGIYYLKSQFFIDLLCILAFVLQFIQDFQLQLLFRMLIFLKIPTLLTKFKIFQNKFIDIFSKEQYYGLIKMFFTNFLLFHIIGIGLLLMSKLDSEDNWLVKKQINLVQWYEKYIWAFYWSATTMLTVGFGDISPATYKEALAVVMIEAVSCMLLAYNINLMGKFLNQLRDQEIQKQKDLRILKQTCKKFQISNDLEFKLTTHVKESHKVQYKEQFQSQSKFVQKLPLNLQNEFLRDTNKNVFQFMSFFKNFTNKSVCKIAEKLNSKLAHPWETVYTLSKKELVILRQGKLGTCPIYKNKPCQQTTIDILQSRQNKNFKLISTNLMRRQYRTQNYDFRSIGYSIINSLDFIDFLNILKDKAVDFEWFLCSMDRQKKETDQQNQQIQCIECKRYHSKFNCPQLHYFPTRQIVIYKSLKKFQKSKVCRKEMYRQKIQVSPLKLFKKYNQKNRQVSESEISSYCLITSEKELNIPAKYCQINKQTNSFNRISRQKKNSTILHLAQSVKKQILGELNGKEKEILFWPVQCDQASNFKYYFPLMNAKNLQSILPKSITICKKANPVIKTKTLKKMFSN